MWTEKKGHRFTIDEPAQFQDDLADVQRDGSFIKNPANGLAWKEVWMFDQMTAAKKSKRLVGRDRTQFSISKVREYRQTVERLKKAHAGCDAHEWRAARSRTGDHAASIPEWGLAGAELLRRQMAVSSL